MDQCRIDYSDDSGMWEAVFLDEPGNPIIRSESREELELFVDMMAVDTTQSGPRLAGAGHRVVTDGEIVDGLQLASQDSYERGPAAQ